jgi:hypothetical protein
MVFLAVMSRARLLCGCVGKAIRYAILSLAVVVLVSAEPATGNPTGTLDQGILHFLNGIIDWYQHQSMDRPAIASPGDVAFVNENQPAVDQIVHLSFDFA